MISWSTKRKLKITSTIILIVIAALLVFFFVFYEKGDSCFDGIQNGTEEGIDCGGSCAEICVFKAANINVLLAKAFPVVDDVYNVLILLENPNFSYRVQGGYHVKMYNTDAIVFHQTHDQIDLAPSEKRAIFLPSIVYAEGEVGKVIVELEPITSLTRDTTPEKEISILSRIISEDLGQTKLTVNLKNESLLPIRNVEVVGVLSAEDGNVSQIGKTFVDYLDKKGSREVFMTWPGSLSEEVSKIDIYTKILD